MTTMAREEEKELLLGDNTAANSSSGIEKESNASMKAILKDSSFMEIDDDHEDGRFSPLEGVITAPSLVRRVVSPLSSELHDASVTLLATSKSGVDGTDGGAVRTHGGGGGGSRLVMFSDDVSVVFIPRRCDYPKDLRDLLYPNKKELSRNVARNKKEFAYDGFDWRKVKEDHEMYITADGERIHPIHLADILSKRKPLLPSGRNLPKPKPRRPVHPSIQQSRINVANPSFATTTDPVMRPPTPLPYFAEGIVG